MSEQHDIVIIGGGPVGAALALALRDSGLDICLLESRPAGQPSRDTRALALSYGSRLLLDRVGVWDKLDQVSPIRTIHISQRGSFGQARIRAEEQAVPELGYVLPYATLHDGLTATLLQHAPDLRHAASVTELQGGPESARIRYRQGDTEQVVHARLAVVADGGRLLAERHPPEQRNYHQSAVIAHINCRHPRPDTAFERFTPQGPVALLPYRDGYELVWTAAPEQAEAMLAWDDPTFLAALQQHFGGRLGTFTAAGPRSCFPLGLRRAPTQAPEPRVLLLGNAAQTLHPVAGQGFNLGLRDAWGLARTVLDIAPAQIGDPAMLDAYRRQRRPDREGTLRFTDSLVRLFSNDLPLLSPTRAAALSALDCLPFAKRFVARRMLFGANG